MSLRKSILIIVSFCLYVQTSPVLARHCPPSSKPWYYQDRGDRCEGVLPEPVGSFDIELLSAVAYREAISSLPKYLNLRFYLPQTDKVYLIVRESEPETYYRMDHVEPKTPWQPGMNHYQWSTTDALQPVSQQKGNSLRINNLSLLARLGDDEPRVEERVAPLIFYDKQLPAKISEYVFIFKTNADAKLTSHLYQGGTPILTEELGIQPGGKPFQVRWRNPQAPRGIYQLVIDGFFTKDNTKINQSVSFYHQPVMK